ncbi:MAG: VOC family protein [Candidatus Pacebacteria bacterium]|nr:VOC family protein [Candidatus Paceibacterota bacterium]MBP9840271.1 VOC family protein [Candidatus Paceibacterota bacterium]
MQKIIPNLWFDGKVEEAVDFYISVFKEGKVLSTLRYGASSAEVSGQPEGSILTIEFELKGQKFVAINGGPLFKFSEAVSFQIDCADQAEVDYFWEKLTADGGEESQCGWLKDKYGLSWQVVPVGFTEMVNRGEPEKLERAMKAMLEMKKLDLAALEAAYNGA